MFEAMPYPVHCSNVTASRAPNTNVSDVCTCDKATLKHISIGDRRSACGSKLVNGNIRHLFSIKTSKSPRSNFRLLFTISTSRYVTTTFLIKFSTPKPTMSSTQSIPRQNPTPFNGPYRLETDITSLYSGSVLIQTPPSYTRVVH